MSLSSFHQMGLGADVTCGLSAEIIRLIHQGAPLPITTHFDWPLDGKQNSSSLSASGVDWLGRIAQHVEYDRRYTQTIVGIDFAHLREGLVTAENQRCDTIDELHGIVAKRCVVFRHQAPNVPGQ